MKGVLCEKFSMHALCIGMLCVCSIHLLTVVLLLCALLYCGVLLLVDGGLRQWRQFCARFRTSLNTPKSPLSKFSGHKVCTYLHTCSLSQCFFNENIP